jgi:uncharacterized protein YjbI with pentapeptide repeats/ABC-type phosphate transport system substrate-binding protein
MRQFVLSVIQAVAFIVFVFFLARYWLMRPISCMPNCMNETLANRSLQGYNLDGGQFMEASLNHTDLSNTSLRGADLSGANLSGADLRHADLTHAKLIGANLTNADLRDAILDDTILRGANLSQANLTRTDLTNAQLRGATFEKALMIEVQLNNTDLSGIIMPYADLTGANLDEALLNGCWLSGANLSSASLVDTELSGCFINIANMSGTNFSGANLSGAYLIGSSFASAHMNNTNLIGATIIGADMGGTLLSGANLTGVRIFVSELKEQDIDLDTALTELNELRIAEISRDATLNGVRFSDATIWPEGKLVLLEEILGTRFHRNQTSLVGEESVTEESGESSVDQTATITKTALITPEIDLSLLTGNLNIATISPIYPLLETTTDSFADLGYTGNVNFTTGNASEVIALLCPDEESSDTEETETAEETSIIATDRLLDEDEETLCRTQDIEPMRFPIGSDAVAIVVNPTNDFVRDVEVEELSKIFTVKNWSDVNADWPSEPIIRYLPEPGTDMYRFVIHSLLDEEAQEALEEDPNTILSAKNEELVRGIATQEYGVGFFSYSYYKQNEETVALLAIEGIEPSEETVYVVQFVEEEGQTQPETDKAEDDREEQAYYPLVRPLYLYTSLSMVEENPQVTEFLGFLLDNLEVLVERTGYFPLDDETMEASRATLQQWRGKPITLAPSSSSPMTITIPITRTDTQTTTVPLTSTMTLSETLLFSGTTSLTGTTLISGTLPISPTRTPTTTTPTSRTPTTTTPTFRTPTTTTPTPRTPTTTTPTPTTSITNTTSIRTPTAKTEGED